MKKSALVSLVFAALAASWGCGGEKGLETRYAYEKQVFAARMAERGIWLEPLSVRDEDLAYAIAAYETVLRENPLLAEDSRSWSPRVRRDIENLRFSMKVSVAKLCFVRLQQHAGVTYFRSAFQRRDLWLRDYANIGLTLVKEVYARQEHDPLEFSCSSILGEIIGDEHLWGDGSAIGDTLMAIPLYLTRIDRERAGSVREHVELGEEFLGRIMSMWPDSAVATKARLARADLYVTAERFDDALADVDAVLAGPFPALSRSELELYRAEILAHGLGRYAEAESALAPLTRETGKDGVWAAALLDVAAIHIKKGEVSDAAEILRGLETSERIPVETQTAAMFLRAIAANEGGDWGEEVTLLWRICRLYPFSRAGMVSPLIMIRHELAAGNFQTLATVHRKAVEFYADAIGRNSAALSYRHLVKDYLIESYCGRTDQECADIFELTGRSREWRPYAGEMS
jgi:tetratricopeptide (TPR) repeat protein